MRDRFRHVARARAYDAAVAAARALSGDPRIELVYVFGSTVDPEQAVVRDVDLGVLTRPALDLDELLRLRADLVGAFSTIVSRAAGQRWEHVSVE